MEYYTCYVMPRAIYTKDHNVIVERLKKARLESGLGQVEVAKKLGKTQSYLSKIELDIIEEFGPKLSIPIGVIYSL